jgi:ectoine hydroxylase-related dioxygenase (phytanoyl-CoA dioxygenase family)
MAVSQLSPASLRSAYERDGFLIHAEPLVASAVVAQAAAGMEALMAGEYDTGVPPQPSYWNPGDPRDKLVKIEQPQVANRAIHALVSSPGVGAVAAAITGARRIQVWWVQLLVKPSGEGEGVATSIGWHQDRHYWAAWEEGSELLTAWVAISNVTEQAGPMRFVRGSHRWGLGPSDFYGQDLEALRRAAQPAGQPWEEVPAILPPGGVSFHHCLTYHASGANRSGEPRRSFALHLRTERSAPAGGRREGLTRFIDDEQICPVIYSR